MPRRVGNCWLADQHPEAVREGFLEGRNHPDDVAGMTSLFAHFNNVYYILESLGFAQNFLSSCELEALHFIGIGSFGEEFREDVVFRGIQEQFRKPLA